MDPIEAFKKEVEANIESLGEDAELAKLTNDWLLGTARHRYTYNFTALGRPIIQCPQDMVAMEELIWKIKPALIIETGIAHGGSLIHYAGALALVDYCEAQQKGEVLDPAKPRRKILGIDIDIRPHNRKEIESHPMSPRIEMIEGSSIDPATIEQVRKRAEGAGTVLISLDSNHTHDHVLAELEAYAPLVTPGSYCVVFDTVIEDMPEGWFTDRPWNKGDNPKTAVWAYLKDHPEFEIDKSIDHKILVSVAPDGYLRRKSA